MKLAVTVVADDPLPDDPVERTAAACVRRTIDYSANVLLEQVPGTDRWQVVRDTTAPGSAANELIGGDQTVAAYVQLAAVRALAAARKPSKPARRKKP